MYKSVQFHIASKFTMLPSYQMWKKPVYGNYLVLITKFIQSATKLDSLVYLGTTFFVEVKIWYFIGLDKQNFLE